MHIIITCNHHSPFTVLNELANALKTVNSSRWGEVIVILTFADDSKAFIVNGFILARDSPRSAPARH